MSPAAAITASPGANAWPARIRKSARLRPNWPARMVAAERCLGAGRSDRAPPHNQSPALARCWGRDRRWPRRQLCGLALSRSTPLHPAASVPPAPPCCDAVAPQNADQRTGTLAQQRHPATAMLGPSCRSGETAPLNRPACRCPCRRARCFRRMQKTAGVPVLEKRGHQLRAPRGPDFPDAGDQPLPGCASISSTARTQRPSSRAAPESPRALRSPWPRAPPPAIPASSASSVHSETPSSHGAPAESSAACARSRACRVDTLSTQDVSKTGA